MNDPKVEIEASLQKPLFKAEEDLQARNSGRRYLELDALRGIAAFCVIWGHFHGAFNDAPAKWYLRPIFSGHPAVILFFVLSGYVLSLPEWRNLQPSYSSYLIRRFFRIYVPYAAAAFISLIGAHFFLNSHLPLTAYFYRTWHTPITLRLVVVTFLTTLSPAINTAFWTLRYEMQMSLVMPFLSKGMKWLGKRWSAAVILFVGTGFELTRQFRPHQENNLIASIHFGIFFAFGALLAQNGDRLRNWTENMSFFVSLFSSFLAATFYFFSDSDAFIGLGAGGIILIALHTKAGRWLKTPLPEYLGWLSYSLYLIHGTVLFALLVLFEQRIPVWLLATVFGITAIAISHVFCRVVEQPSLTLGRKLTGRKT